MDFIISILITIVIGAIVGLVAGFIMGSGGTWLRNIVCGILGGFVGGIIGNFIQINIPFFGFILAVIGACIVIAIARVLKI